MHSTRMHRRDPPDGNEAILYDVSDCIGTVTLNRPDKLNAWTRQMHIDLKDAL